MRHAGRLLCILMACCSANAFVVLTDKDGHPLHWDASVPIKWTIQGDYPVGLRPAVLNALQRWGAASNNILQFEEDSANPKLVVEWRTISTDIGLYGKAYTVNDGDQITSALILINSVPPDLNDQALLDLVVLHEVGHALGLGHSDDDPLAVVGLLIYRHLPIMQAYISSNRDEALAEDDIAGILFLYTTIGSIPEIVVSPPVRLGFLRSMVPCTIQLSLPITASWDLGDGTNKFLCVGQPFVHKFKPGTYTIRVRVSRTQIEKTITVSRRRPKKSK